MRHADCAAGEPDVVGAAHWPELGQVSQPAGKPNSVRLRPAAPLGASGLRRDDHSSRPVIAHGLERPTRWPRTGRPTDRRRACARWRPTPPYLVLLRAGFCLPPTLPPARCALTAPFHPYLSTHPFGVRSRQARETWPALSEPWRGESKGGIFSVPLVRQVALPGRYPAPCPAEFGLSSPSGTSRRLRFPEAAVVWPAATIHYRVRR